MNSYTDRTQKNNSRSAASNVVKEQNKVSDTINKSLYQQQGYKAMADNFIAQAVQRQENIEEPVQGKFETIQRIEEEEPLQGKFEAIQRMEEEEPLQGKWESPQAHKGNNTGLPDTLKSGIENLSGYSMDDVKVHYNSDKPAQLQAHAYAQGTDIHLASGQEKHLPHEAWHVVQQKQGRVQPTLQMKGNVPINDDAGLEKEADVMGEKANSLPVQLQGMEGGKPVQGKLSTIQLEGEGLRYRGKKVEEKKVSFTVGRRTAFFKYSQATHAVYRMDGVVYGLAGDFGGVDIGADTEVKNPAYDWGGGNIDITENEAQVFQRIAKSVSSGMKYNLVTQNCYTPVVTALQDLINQNMPSEGEEATEKYLKLIAFKESLAGDNFGAGQQQVDLRAKKAQ